MRLTLSVLVFALLSSAVFADPDSDAAAAIAIAKAKAAKKDKTTKEPTYAEVKAKCEKEGKPLVIFVGCKGRSLKFSVGIGVAEGYFEDYPAKCIIVGDSKGYVKGVLSSTATDALIEDCLKGVSQSASPFRQGLLRRGERRTADDDRLDPQLRDLLADMEPYESAKMTQTTFRRWVGYITPSSRLSLENKWIVPGHLDGVEGWSSRLYRKRGIKATEFLIRQDPNDGDSAVTWGRSYPDGAEFVDVLRNEKGILFEVRVASKQDGSWERYVAYRVREEVPTGYVKPRSADCRSCHSQAGRSEYAGAAIPGSDTVISEPINALEHGGSVQGGYGTRLN